MIDTEQSSDSQRELLPHAHLRAPLPRLSRPHDCGYQVLLSVEKYEDQTSRYLQALKFFHHFQVYGYKAVTNVQSLWFATSASFQVTLNPLVCSLEMKTIDTVSFSLQPSSAVAFTRTAAVKRLSTDLSASTLSMGLLRSGTFQRQSGNVDVDLDATSTWVQSLAWPTYQLGDFGANCLAFRNISFTSGE